MPKLSVIIITKNEAENIKRCLQSVAFADEIIVVDSGSTDETQAICESFNVKFHSMDWPGYGEQKNRALLLASGQWVLSIDADEELSMPLQETIKTVIKNDKFDAYSIKVQLIFNNKVIKHAVGSDRHIRLFQRQKAKFKTSDLHESISVEGKVGQLTAPMYHYSFRNIDTLIDKMNRYTSISAAEKFKAGNQSGCLRASFSSLWIFIRLYLLQGGFLDGKEGLVLAASFAHGAFYRYMKLAFLR